ncbi:hypothetical protein BDR26DRAFT_837172 [Obelidium mucronatum]|nr:hypothetical protein BDR26DRAFT_837172 [Obelidium mucronatum]
MHQHPQSQQQQPRPPFAPQGQPGGQPPGQQQFRPLGQPQPLQQQQQQPHQQPQQFQQQPGAPRPMMPMQAPGQPFMRPPTGPQSQQGPNGPINSGGVGSRPQFQGPGQVNPQRPLGALSLLF